MLDRCLCQIHSSMALKETQAHLLWQEMYHREEPSILLWLLVLPNCFHIQILSQKKVRQENIKHLNIIALTIDHIDKVLPRSGLVIVIWCWLDSEETVELWVELDLMDLTDAMKGKVFGGLGLCLGTTVAVWLHSAKTIKKLAIVFSKIFKIAINQFVLYQSIPAAWKLHNINVFSIACVRFPSWDNGTQK